MVASVAQAGISPEVEAFSKWRDDPIRYQVECLDVNPAHVWDKMEEVAYSVRDNEMTAVKAGHSVSKSYEAARLALWFLATHPPATVITTAPTHNQVENVLWREIRDAYSQAKIPLGGKITATKLDMAEKWFALGFSTRPDTVTKQATAFQGFHNRHVLIIFDEAAGILPQIWQAAETLMADSFCRWLAIGNPTSAFGNFAACFDPDSEWNKITISVKDTPNYKLNADVIPGLAGVKFERRIRRTYGEKSNYYRSRVLGEIPEVIEGAVFGKEVIAARKEGRVCKIHNEKTALVNTAWDLGVGDPCAIWFYRLVQMQIHVIDYYEADGEGFIHYAEVLDIKRRENDWLYGKHFAPHDIEHRQLGATAETRRETARKVGIRFQVIPKLSIGEGIEAVRQIFPRCWFDEVKCVPGLKSLAEYRWKKIERLSTDDRAIYSTKPESDDWASHGADAFRYMGLSIVRGTVKTKQDAGSVDWASYYSKQV